MMAAIFPLTKSNASSSSSRACSISRSSVKKSISSSSSAIRVLTSSRSAFIVINLLAIKPPKMATMDAEHAAIVVKTVVRSYILLSSCIRSKKIIPYPVQFRHPSETMGGVFIYHNLKGGVSHIFGQPSGWLFHFTTKEVF